MSSETFTTAMFLMAAIISAGVLINAVFPVIYTLSGTIASSSHKVDERLSTDVKIVTTYANGDDKNARIWLKNVGTGRIAENDIRKADVFLGGQGDFERLAWAAALADERWTHEILEETPNNYWDPGETLSITVKTGKVPAEERIVYFQFVLPTGLSRTTTFTASGNP
ncbi:flagellin [Methanoculleus sp. Wushi-C6]|uniref:Flagellin n=1 Tax=Methanoculleus caldifontis TaxID=2651577 RepID=A0ABU3X2P7_9EURY|nr:flagellin [Methanoculleus sp. Wushi-C6]MDV2482343.1 flagellin [Methanoculleus sp. Wushi-C6]